MQDSGPFRGGLAKLYYPVHTIRPRKVMLLCKYILFCPTSYRVSICHFSGEVDGLRIELGKKMLL
jgi:hypothetical protein